jgi:GTP-binding protein HflX
VLVGVDVGGSAFDPRWTNWRCWRSRPATWPVARVTAKRKAPDPALFVGSGKADEIKAWWLDRAHGVIFDQALSPAQQRNLERHLGVPVADRTG